MNYEPMRSSDLWNLLSRETSFDCPMTAEKIVERLRARGIRADLNALPGEIEKISRSGKEVLTRDSDGIRSYWVAKSDFITAEQRIIADLVQGAKFLPVALTMDMISKISSLQGGGPQAQIMMKGNIRFNSRKHSNESILENVSTINEALLEKKRISFFYFKLNEFHERDYRNEHKRYFVDPIGCIATEDFYYLLGHSLKDQEARTYRIDRMDHVEKEEEDIGEEARAAIPDINKFNGQVFKMYSSEPVAVTLEFPRQLVEQIYDRFGEETEVEVLGDGNCRVTQEVQPSPTFFSWVFTYGKEMKIVAPGEVAEQMKKMLAEVSAAYDNMI